MIALRVCRCFLGVHSFSFFISALQGQEMDAGAGILTSVGQNTPPPSPKAGTEEDDSDEDEPIPVMVRYYGCSTVPREVGQANTSVKCAIVVELRDQLHWRGHYYYLTCQLFRLKRFKPTKDFLLERR